MSRKSVIVYTLVHRHIVVLPGSCIWDEGLLYSLNHLNQEQYCWDALAGANIIPDIVYTLTSQLHQQLVQSALWVATWSHISMNFLWNQSPEW